MSAGTTHASSRVDTLGAAASSLCALHCTVTAMTPHLIVALGLGTALGPKLEWGLTGVAIAIAGISLLLRWKNRRSARVAWFLAGGMSGLLVGRFFEEAGMHAVGSAVAIISGLGLVIGHTAGILATWNGQD